MYFGPPVSNSRIRQLLGRPKASPSLKAITADGLAVVDIMTFPSDTDWQLVLTPRPGAEGLFWTIAIGLAAAKLGDGRFYGHELWDSQQYPDDPTACLEALVSKAATLATSPDLATAIKRFIDAVG